MSRYLIVDDNSEVRSVLRSILSQALDDGALVIDDADDATSALDHIRASPYDLVLLDIGLGDQGGLSVLKKVHRERPQQAVLMVSMQPEDLYARTCLKMGASGYLEKRHAMRELTTAVTKIGGGGQYMSKHVAALLTR
jgi:DNA-binding NarL/FixJ family response regulator